MTSYSQFAQQLETAAERVARPVHATLSLTHRCNLSCVHCFLNGSRAAAELDADGWRTRLDELAELGVLWITLTGGEPLVRRDFVQIYRHAKALGFLIKVMTNAVRVDAGLLSVFRELPPLCVDVSLYAMSGPAYESITGADVARTVFSNVEALLAQGTRVTVKSVAMRGNVDELEEIRRWATARSLHFRVDADVIGRLDGTISNRRLDEEVILQLQPVRAQPSTPTSRRFICRGSRRSLHLAPDGAASVCILDPPIVGPTTPLQAGWQALRARWDEVLPLGHPCAACRSRTLCRACPPVLRIEAHSEDSTSTERCRLARAQVST